MRQVFLDILSVFVSLLSKSDGRVAAKILLFKEACVLVVRPDGVDKDSVFYVFTSYT